MAGTRHLPPDTAYLAPRPSPLSSPQNSFIVSPSVFASTRNSGMWSP